MQNLDLKYPVENEIRHGLATDSTEQDKIRARTTIKGKSKTKSILGRVSGSGRGR